MEMDKALLDTGIFSEILKGINPQVASSSSEQDLPLEKKDHNMKSICQLCLLLILILPSLNLAGQTFIEGGTLFQRESPSPSSAGQDAIDLGEISFQSGHFEQAVESWEKTLASLSTENSPAKYIDISIRLAVAYQTLGRLKTALEVLQRAEDFANKIHDSIRQANILSQLSDVYLAMRNLNTVTRSEFKIYLQQAQGYLEQAEKRVISNDLLRANLLNKKGNLLVALKKYEEAVKTYQESVRLSEQVGDKVLTAKTLINRLQAMVESGDNDLIQQGLSDKETLLRRVQDLPDSHDKAFALIRLAYLVQSSSRATTKERQYIFATLQQALDIAQKQRDHLAIAYAKGHLAQLDAEEKRFDEAIKLTQQAILATPTALGLGGSPELLYRWEWQLGKFLKAQGKFSKAIDAYNRAKEHLKEARRIYRCVPNAFCKNIQEFYFELADLQLQETTKRTAADEQKQLKEVRKNLESFQTSELQTYLNTCVTEALENLEDVENRLPKDTVGFYPIVLEDRIELLLVSNNGIRQITVPNIRQDKLKETVNQLRENFQDFRYSSVDWYLRKEKNWLEPAQQLYQWLIKPITAELERQKIDTIVIVPDGILTTLSFAALYDKESKKYLFEKYALAITPSLVLTDFTKFEPPDQFRALLVGIAKFPNSPSLRDSTEESTGITKELAAINPMLERDILQNERATLSNIEATVGKNVSYSIIHFATHGRFDENSNEFFLQTYDGRLTLDKLEEIITNNNSRGKQLELITFSASETAIGSESSSLGLAGLAIKTGARSALASLWNVSDYATARLMTEFYRQWKDNHFSSKAKALQQAQLKLLMTPELAHPYFWAAFVLIGNWQ